MAVETRRSPDMRAGQRADAALSARRTEQDKRLRRWGKWFLGGVGISAAAVGAAFIPGVGVPLAYSLWSAGGLAGTVGIVGFLSEAFRGKNKK